MSKAVILHGEQSSAGLLELAELLIPGNPPQLQAGELNIRIGAQLFSPGGSLQLGDVARHHIIPSDLEDKQTFEMYNMPEGYDVVIGHGLDSFLPTLKLHDHPEYTAICTKRLCQIMWPGLDSYELHAMIYLIGFKCGDGAWARGLVLDNSKQGSAKTAELVLILVKFILNTCRDVGAQIAEWQEMNAITVEPPQGTEE